jgi:pimeloyl-ACP methyl ester carboxylesterase
MIRILEEKPVGQFHYRRYEIDSPLLARKNTFGVLQAFSFDDLSVESEFTLCFIHGGDGNDQQFVLADFLSCFGEKNLKELVQRKTKIILPSIGLTFLKAPADRHLLDEVIPFVENHRRPARRGLLGISMGGAAAFHLCLNYPGFFDALATHFASFIDFNPFDENGSLAYQQRTGISDQKRDELSWCYHQGFRDAKDYDRYDPLQKEKESITKLPQGNIYFDCGTHDDFGLFEGTRKWSEMLSKFGLSHQFFLEEGGKHDLAFLQRRLSFAISYLLGHHN